MIRLNGKTIKLYLISLFINLAPSAFGSTKEIIINIQNLRTEKGNLNIAVFSKNSTFPKEDSRALATFIVPIIEDIHEFKIPIIAKSGWSEVAIAVFLDSDFNKKLTKNIFGIPKEAFGFSKNPSLMRGAPTFDDCKFSIKNTEIVKIYLKRFFH